MKRANLIVKADASQMMPGCHTQAKTLKELDKRVKEAIQANLEVRGQDFRIQVVAVKKVHV